jgi:nitroreductase
MDAIRSRRSIRKYKPIPVPNEKIRQLIEAAILAPTGGNLQAWRFVIVTDERILKKIAAFSPGMSFLPPAMIIVCTDSQQARTQGGTNSERFMASLDAAYASQNIMLEAVDLALGTCAIKSYHEGAVRKIIHLPEHLTIELLIALGYPDQTPTMPKRTPIDEIMRYNIWEDPQ